MRYRTHRSKSSRTPLPLVCWNNSKYEHGLACINYVRVCVCVCVCTHACLCFRAQRDGSAAPSPPWVSGSNVYLSCKCSKHFTLSMLPLKVLSAPSCIKDSTGFRRLRLPWVLGPCFGVVHQIFPNIFLSHQILVSGLSYQHRGKDDKERSVRTFPGKFFQSSCNIST